MISLSIVLHKVQVFQQNKFRLFEAVLSDFKVWSKEFEKSGIYKNYSKLKDQFGDKESKFEVRNDKPFTIEFQYLQISSKL